MSPDAFFQINSKAAEILYSTIGELILTEEQACKDSNSENNTVIYGMAGVVYTFNDRNIVYIVYGTCIKMILLIINFSILLNL